MFRKILYKLRYIFIELWLLDSLPSYTTTCNNNKVSEMISQGWSPDIAFASVILSKSPERISQQERDDARTVLENLKQYHRG